MKAVVIHALGGPDQLTLAEMPDPVPGAGEGPAGQATAEPPLTLLRIDHEPQLAHVVRPAGQRDDGGVARDVAILDRDPAPAAV